MVLEKLPPVVMGGSEQRKIVFAAQNQIVILRQEIVEARFRIGAGKVEAVILVVKEKLLPDVQVGVERFGDLRLIINAAYWCDYRVALLVIRRQRHVRRPKNW